MRLFLLFAIQIDGAVWEQSGKADYANQSGVIHSDERDVYSSAQDALKHSCENPEESWRVPSLSSGREHKNNLHPKMLSAEVDICRRFMRRGCVSSINGQR